MPKGTPECQNALKCPHFGETIATYGGTTTTPMPTAKCPIYRE